MELLKFEGVVENSDDDDDNQPNHLLLPSFPPCLSQLKIVGCSNLTCMPLFPYLKEDLKMVRVSSKVLQQTMKMKMGATTSPSSCYFPLSQLQSMELCSVKDLESYPEEWLQNLDSLWKLKIYNCEELGSLPWMANLTSLQPLSIQGCLNLTSLPQGIRNTTSLKQLTIENCPILWRRCLRPTGEDWPIISHVPRMIVEYEK
uniref:CC-NBS-LRR protein n=1 Tax=Quercus lobata TaxID=97700 RepID=A0A7N2LDA9_QUELO